MINYLLLSIKTVLGELVKDEIQVKYSIGFYPNGAQEFFVGLVGTKRLFSKILTRDLQKQTISWIPDANERKDKNTSYLYFSHYNNYDIKRSIVTRKRKFIKLVLYEEKNYPTFDRQA